MRYASLSAILAGVLTALHLSVAAAPVVRVVAVPHGGAVPDAKVDSKGNIHLVYVADEDVCYVRSTDDGQTFSEPVRVNSEPHTAAPPRLFRGPDLAIGKDEVVHVIWYTNAYQRKLPKNQRGVYYSRLDGGTFEPAVNLNHLPSDGYSIAANRDGTVAILWLAGAVNLSVSRDGGRTFAPPETITEIDPCECCGTRLAFTPDGALLASVRDKTDNIRDMFLLAGRPGGKLSRLKLSGRPWPINGCPMTGTSLSASPTGIVAAWETQGFISFARLDPTGRSMQGAETRVARGKWPVALAAADGSILVAWKEGATIAWQWYDGGNRALGNRESKSASNGDRFSAVATRTGEYLIFP